VRDILPLAVYFWVPCHNGPFSILFSVLLDVGTGLRHTMTTRLTTVFAIVLTVIHHTIIGYISWMLVNLFATMAPPKDDRGDTIPSFSLWQKIQKVPLLLALRESQPQPATPVLHLTRPPIMSQLSQSPSGSSAKIRAALGAVPRTSRRHDTSWERRGTLRT
jgi:hypothetical protein